MAGAIAAVVDERLPLSPAEKRAGLADSFCITTLTEQPPAVGHTKADLYRSRALQRLIDDERTSARDKELQAMPKGAAHEWRCMQNICCDQQIALVWREALQSWVGIDVEQGIFDESEHGKAGSRLPQEDFGDICEDVCRTCRVKGWQ